MADRQDVARRVTFYLVLPVAGPVFFVVGLRQALTSGGTQRQTVARHRLPGVKV